MSSMPKALHEAGLAPAPVGGISRIDYPMQFGKKVFSNEQLISFLRMVIKPSDEMRKRINAFLKDRTDRRYIFFVAERSLATFTADNADAIIGNTERDENDGAVMYNVYDLRQLNKIVYKSTTGLTTTFTRIDEGSFNRVESR